ncbi:uncharacterized protein LOC131846021 [Achroia grisella]|uniref:uncharacterized protein LOC131846021 n=1 Tax=Achroia grisella TaxID=688607 RepID=UPI0027D2FC49|nr:uncharacterized protein LOC131846021 [Achroia grisella]XP_059051208.1 uncharacterized protein LOC131846021 [Achroia grisella]XP_059051209.1 uncharacterized protein LOC131846021 [Achroia grisella]
MAEGIIVFMLWYIAIAFNYYIENCTKNENEEGTQTKNAVEKYSNTSVSYLTSNDGLEENKHEKPIEVIPLQKEKVIDDADVENDLEPESPHPDDEAGDKAAITDSNATPEIEDNL